MAKKTSYLHILPIIGLILIAYAINPTVFKMIGLGAATANLEITVTNDDDNPVAAYCWTEADETTGTPYKSTYTNMNGVCTLTGYPVGEVYSWGTRCEMSSTIEDRGTFTAEWSPLGIVTVNKQSTLNGCETGTTTSSTTTTQVGCGIEDEIRCYSGDEWMYDNCGNRLYKHEECGQDGCQFGLCVNPTTTTTTTSVTGTTASTGTTTTTLCADDCMWTGCQTDPETGRGYSCVTGPDGCMDIIRDIQCDTVDLWGVDRVLSMLMGALSILWFIVKR